MTTTIHVYSWTILSHKERASIMRYYENPRRRVGAFEVTFIPNGSAARIYSGRPAADRKASDYFIDILARRA